jgi:hypothetical protein
MQNFKLNCLYELKPSGAVVSVRFYPQTPQGGLYNFQDFNKSPLGDLGVKYRKLAFSIASETEELLILNHQLLNFKF